MAAWLLIALLLIFVAVFAVATARYLGVVMSRRGDTLNVVSLAISITWRVALIAAFMAAAHSIYCRRSWSRWLGVASIVGVAVFSLLGPDTTSYANEAERTGGHLARTVLMPLLLAWWAYAFGFSAKAKRYFCRGLSSA